MKLALALLALVSIASARAQPETRVLVLYQVGGHHAAYTERAKVWLEDLAKRKHLKIDTIRDTETIDKSMLDSYQLFIELDYPPYGWKPAAAEAFEDYIENGKGGWIGFHHASLVGEFDGYPTWQWFAKFIGGIRWKDYIPDFAKGTVHVEDRKHPIMRGVPATFEVQKEEWYTYDKDPRPNVHVIASVDENSYVPDSKVKMGDHPVIWTNPNVKARNVYIFMGHDPILFDDKIYCQIFENAVLWASGRTK